MAKDDLEAAKGLEKAVQPGLPGKIVSLPQLSFDQAYYLSLVADGLGDEAAMRMFEDELGRSVDISSWGEGAEFRAAIALMIEDRKEFLKALSLALAGRAWRALARMIDSERPKESAIGVTLLLRMHGMLIDRVRHESPEAVRALMAKLQEKQPVRELSFESIE